MHTLTERPHEVETWIKNQVTWLRKQSFQYWLADGPVARDHGYVEPVIFLTLAVRWDREGLSWVE